MEEKWIEEKGELNRKEPHPAAYNALEFLRSISHEDLILIRDGFISCEHDSPLAKICLLTLDRLSRQESISDKYLLGLAFTITNLSIIKNKQKNKTKTNKTVQTKTVRKRKARR